MELLHFLVTLSNLLLVYFLTDFGIVQAYVEGLSSEFPEIVDIVASAGDDEDKVPFEFEEVVFSCFVRHVVTYMSSTYRAQR
jgi:hypothetical protein